MPQNRCPRSYPFQILGRKWSYRTLRVLAKPTGFAQLQHELVVITNRTLSRELSQLVAEGLVTRVGDRYQRTPAGERFVAAAEPLVNWSISSAGCRDCPPELSCARCASYPESLGLVQLPGRKRSV